MSRALRTSPSGQASVEFVALLPVLLLLALALWQCVVAGQALWLAGGAARAAARAQALGQDARAAAQRVLPASLLVARVAQRDGSSEVAVRVPLVVDRARGFEVRARAHYARQGP